MALVGRRETRASPTSPSITIRRQTPIASSRWTVRRMRYVCVGVVATAAATAVAVAAAAAGRRFVRVVAVRLTFVGMRKISFARGCALFCSAWRRMGRGELAASDRAWLKRLLHRCSLRSPASQSFARRPNAEWGRCEWPDFLCWRCRRASSRKR